MSRDQSRRKKKRDLTLLIILCLLLLIPLTIDHMFDHLRAFLSSNRAGNAGTGTGKQGGDGDSDQPIYQGRPLLPSLSDPGHPGQNGLAGLQGYEGSGRSSLEALAAVEREQLERWQRSLRGSNAPSKQSEGWVYVEPMPSLPSRYFPELRKATLSSGVELSTGPDEKREAERLGENVFGKAMPSKEAVRENPWGKGTAAIEPPPESNWGKGTPQEPQPENNWGKGNPERNLASKRPIFNLPQDSDPEPQRFDFKAQPPPKARPTEQARTEKLIEVCGRMVPVSKAAMVSLECQPKPAPEQAKKPPQQSADEGGSDSLLLP